MVQHLASLASEQWPTRPQQHDQAFEHTPSKTCQAPIILHDPQHSPCQGPQALRLSLWDNPCTLEYTWAAFGSSLSSLMRRNDQACSSGSQVHSMIRPLSSEGSMPYRNSSISGAGRYDKPVHRNSCGRKSAHLGSQAFRVWSCSYLREMRLDALDRAVVAAPSPRPAFKDLQQALLIGVNGKARAQTTRAV